MHGDRWGCPSARPGCPAGPALLRAPVTPESPQHPVHQPCRSPGGRVSPCPLAPPRALSSAPHAPAGTLLPGPAPAPASPTPRRGTEPGPAGHCHFTLRPPDANSKPGHLLQRKESWRSFPSRAEAELGEGAVLREELGSEGAGPCAFQVVLSACSKKHDFGRGFCWAVPRPRAPARPGRAAQANCFHVLHSSQTDISPGGRRKGREEREQGLV